MMLKTAVPEHPLQWYRIGLLTWLKASEEHAATVQYQHPIDTMIPLNSHHEYTCTPVVVVAVAAAVVAVAVAVSLAGTVGVEPTVGSAGVAANMRLE